MLIGARLHASVLDPTMVKKDRRCRLFSSNLQSDGEGGKGTREKNILNYER